MDQEAWELDIRFVRQLPFSGKPIPGLQEKRNNGHKEEGQHKLLIIEEEWRRIARRGLAA